MTRAQQRRVDLANPVTGPYLVRLVPRGWPIAARILRDGGMFQVEVDGSVLSDHWTHDELPDLAVAATMAGALNNHPLFRVVLFGRPCSEAAYQHRLAMKAWAREHAPDHPCLTPTVPMDPNKTPAVDF